jgi:hypothetical protein
MGDRFLHLLDDLLIPLIDWAFSLIMVLVISGVFVTTSFSPLTSAPTLLMSSNITNTSSNLGILLSFTSSSESNDAAIMGNAAFFAPLIDITPSNLFPPSIISNSLILIPPRYNL